MRRTGRRHMLVIYKFMVDRWWKAILIIGFVLLLIAVSLRFLPLLLPQFPAQGADGWQLWLLGGTGGLAVLFGLFLITIRKLAYVQPFSDHLRLVTPFLRLNISYRRIRRTTTLEMQQLFPAKKQSKWNREILRPLASQTVVVIEMNAFPISRDLLRMFLSPYFFPDQTPRLALLVPDWIAFSTDLESMRSTWQDGLKKNSIDSNANLYSKIMKKG